MKLLPVYLLMLMLVGCNATRLTSSTQVSNVTKDSLVYVDRVIVDTVKIPADTLFVEVPAEVFKRDTVVVYKNGRASTQIIYRNGKVTLNTRCDSLEKLVLSRDRQIYNLHKSINKTSTETKEKVNQRVPWYYKLAMLLVFGFVLFFIVKLIRNQVININHYS